MGSEKKNSFLGVSTLCNILFIAVSYLIFRTDLPRLPLILFYNIAIILSFQHLGFIRGVFYLAASVLLVMLLSLSMNIYYIWNVPLFFLTFLIVDYRVKKMDYYSRIMEARIEEVKEDINLVSNQYERHKKESQLLDKKDARYKLLHEITSRLNSTLSIEKVAEEILNNAIKVIGKTDAAMLYLVDTERQELYLVLSRGRREFERIKAKKGDLLDETVFRERRCLFVEDIKKDYRFAEQKFEPDRRPFRSVISSPLVSERKIIGIVRLESARPNNYTSEDLRVLDILCDLGAVSLENARLYKQTLDLAIRDSLTGLYLRRYFIERFSEELQRSLRNDLFCSLLMIDIDNFKVYNDKYGHTAGDIVLKTLASVLARYMDSGIACRYGGEEFCVLLPETSHEEAIKIAEEIRKAVKNEKIELRRQKTRVTISIGLSNFPKDAKVMDELIALADDRLYTAKRRGRDRVVFK